MRIHEFIASARDLQLCCARVDGDGKLCSQTADAGIHQRTEPRYHLYEKLTVNVSDPTFTVHLGNVSWTREDGGSWYAGWVQPHSEPGKWYRRKGLDQWDLFEAAALAVRLAEGNFSRADADRLFNGTEED